VPVPKGMSREEYQSKVQEPMAKRVCNVIKYWIEKASLLSSCFVGGIHLLVILAC